jgi:hypothetical protein
LRQPTKSCCEYLKTAVFVADVQHAKQLEAAVAAGWQQPFSALKAAKSLAIEMLGVFDGKAGEATAHLLEGAKSTVTFTQQKRV